MLRHNSHVFDLRDTNSGIGSEKKVGVIRFVLLN